MATYTSNLNLEKPLQTELYNVDVFNANSDKIDAGVGARVRYADALTLEEIMASTDLTNKVAAASAAKSLRESLSTHTRGVGTPNTTYCSSAAPYEKLGNVCIISGDLVVTQDISNQLIDLASGYPVSVGGGGFAYWGVLINQATRVAYRLNINGDKLRWAYSALPAGTYTVFIVYFTA